LFVSRDLSKTCDKFLLEKPRMINKKMLSRDDDDDNDDDNCEKNYCEKSDCKRQRGDNNDSRGGE